MSQFRDILEKELQKRAIERGEDFIESRNDSQHETGWQRGYLICLKDVLTLCQEVEKKINDA